MKLGIGTYLKRQTPIGVVPAKFAIVNLEYAMHNGRSTLGWFDSTKGTGEFIPVDESDSGENWTPIPFQRPQ